MAAWDSCGRGSRTAKDATSLERALSALALLGLAACAEELTPVAKDPPSASAATQPRSARPQLRAELLADLAAVRHAADGGGRAWIEGFEDRPATAIAGESGSWCVVYEAGARGIAVGGSIDLQVSPFWGWSTPQTEREDAAGFTLVECAAAGVELDLRTSDLQRLRASVGGRALAQGEQVRFRYGAGAAGAKADDFAERGERFWLAVDGDGDGVRAWVLDSPRIDVLAGPAALLSVVAPSVLRPGESALLRLALLDRSGNAGVREGARLSFLDAPALLGLPESCTLEADSGAVGTAAFAAGEAGTHRFRARATLADGRELACDVGPIVVSATAPRILWADLHGHSNESDGSGTPEHYWRYARDVAGLDMAALTDHDHWGIRFIDQRLEDWRAFTALARSFDAPGSFVALPGYEYTDWIHGHRCVLWFGDEAALYSSLDERSDTPQELWSLLRGKPALSIPHHVAGGPIALDWELVGEGAIEPVVEITSVHGSSEAADGERRIYSPVPGHFARDGLRRGHVLGFIGSGDSHDGHPGLSHLGGHYAGSGLAGIVCEERTKEALLAALRSRRVFATSGARILVRFSLAGKPMGAIVGASEVAKSAALFAQASGPAPIRSIDVIQGDSVAISVDGDGSCELTLSGALEGLRAGEWVYVRVLASDGSQAWSSPIFVR